MREMWGFDSRIFFPHPHPYPGGRRASKPTLISRTVTALVRRARVRIGIIGHRVQTLRSLAVVLLCLSMLAWSMSAMATLELTRAEFLLSDARQPPPDSANWQYQGLPDH